MVLELPARGRAACPVGCRHCIHQAVKAGPEPELSGPELEGLVRAARGMGVPLLTAYPHRGDASLDPGELAGLLGLARGLGLKTKTLTSGADPAGVARLLPLLDRLAVSVDALDAEGYAAFRPPANHPALLETLRVLEAHRRRAPGPALTALVMVGRSTLGTVGRRVAEIADLRLFDKIKVQEVLPLGRAEALEGEALDRPEELQRLAHLRGRWSSWGLRVGVPLWRLRPGGLGCRLGQKDLVVGPRGQLAGCTLMLYLGEAVGSSRDGSLPSLWEEAFGVYRRREGRPVPASCGACRHYRADRCWGGCLARRRIFGDAVELARSCGARAGAALACG